MLKRLTAVAILCLCAGGVSAQTVPAWISKSKNPTTGKVVTADVIAAFLGSKADTTNGVLTSATLANAVLKAAQLDAASSGVTQPAGDNSQLLATTGYVDRQAATTLNLATAQALAYDTIACPQITVGAAQTLAFAKTGSACYNLLLSVANPALTLTAPQSGTAQSIQIAVTQPASGALAWSAPTTTSGTIRQSPAFAPNTVAGSTLIFNAQSLGDTNIYLTGGTTYGGGTVLAYATGVSVDTPAQTTPGTAFQVTGVESGGTSTAFDVSTDNFAHTTLISAPAIAGTAFSFTVAGLPAGSYTVAVRDHNNPTAAATSGAFVVSPWTPSNLTTSPGAFAVYASDPNSPTLAPTDSSGNLLQLVNSLNSGQYMLPTSGATGNKVQVARASGADGKRRLVKFHPALTNVGAGDASANWLTAGNLQTAGGYAGSGLLSLANSTNQSTSGSYTAIIGMNFDTSSTSAIAYEAGFIWATLAVPGPDTYVQNRWNPPTANFSVQIVDATGTLSSATTPVTAGYHVITMIKNAGTIIYRQDGVQVATATITSTGATKFDGTYGDFMLGGSSNTGQKAENGDPPPFMGAFEAYSGVLQGADLAGAEKYVGNTIGLTLNPTVPTTTPVATSISVGPIASAVANTAITVPFSYAGSPQAVAYQVDQTGVWTTATATISGGTGSFSIAGGLTAGSHQIGVRDVNATAISGLSAAFTVTAPVTYAGSIAVATPSGVQPGVAFPVTATYAGGTGDPQALDYAFDSSGAWVQLTTATIGSGAISFTTLGGVAAGSHTIQVRDRDNFSSAGTSASFTVAAPATNSSATALALVSPQSPAVGAAVTFTGTYAGSLQQIDYQLNNLGWGAPQNVSFANGKLSFVMPAGNADTAGANTVQIRDHFTQSVLSSAVGFYVTNFSPTTLTTSPGAAAVWAFDASNATQVATAADGSVPQVFNAITPAQYLTAKTGSGAVSIKVSTASGADGVHRALQFSPTTSSTFQNGDPTANWLSGSAGAGTGLLTLANSPNVNTTGSFTVIEAARLDRANAFQDFASWGMAASPGPLQYAQLRYNSGPNNVSAQVADSSGTFAGASGSAATGWHVYTMIKSPGQIVFRQDGVQIATASITSTGSFTSGDFMIGGGFPGASATNTTGEYGAPPPFVTGFEAYSGVLAGTDLGSAEALVGASAGVTVAH